MSADVRTAPAVSRVRGWGEQATAFLVGPIPLAIILALFVGGIFISIGGANPLQAYGVMLEGSLTGPGLVNTMQRAVPLIGMALAVAVAFRAGVFNLGTEGQMVLGALAGTCVALFMPGPGPLVILVAFAAAVLAGGLWAALSAWMENALAVPILISSLLLAYPARSLASYLIRFPLKEDGSSLVATAQVPEATRITVIVPRKSEMGDALVGSLGRDNVLAQLLTKLDWSLPIIVAIVIAFWFIARRTTTGYESGMVGVNPLFAAYGGVSTPRVKVQAMFTSGALAGVVGLMLVLGPQGRLTDGAMQATGYAFTGILVALLAANRPIGIAIAGLFFAAIIVGGEAMQRGAGVSSQIASVIQAVIIIFIALRVVIRWKRKKAEPRMNDTDTEEV